MKYIKKMWVKHKEKILYHLRSLADSFATGVLMYLLANWGTVTTSVSNLEWAALSGLVVAGLRSGWKMASRQIFSLLLSIKDSATKKK